MADITIEDGKIKYIDNGNWTLYHGNTKMQETYEHEIICWNCGCINVYDILKGITIDEHMEESKCMKCGCNPRLYSQSY